jgi:hypothetical protein
MCRRVRSANSIHEIFFSRLSGRGPERDLQESEIGAPRSEARRGGDTPRHILSERSHYSNA